jgi:ribonuclease HII
MPREVVYGVDEVGVSAIAGPIIAVAYTKIRDGLVSHVRDSKSIKNRNERKALSNALITRGYHGVGCVSPAEIDKINCRAASILAMERAVRDLSGVVEPTRVISDYYSLDVPHNEPHVKADQKFYVVQGASIIAKVLRDKVMAELENGHLYQWESNVGYPSRAHRLGILKYGFTEYHRMRYAVKSAVSAQKRLREEERWSIATAEALGYDIEELLSVDIGEMANETMQEV